MAKQQSIPRSSNQSTVLKVVDIFGFIVDIVLDLLLVFIFLKLWIAPEIADAQRIYCLAILMGFEFIMVHSGVFMAAMPFKISLLVFVPAYALFAFVFNLMVPDNSVIILYLVVVFNRMRFAFFNTNTDVKMNLLAQSVIAAITYFLLLIFVVAVGNGLIPKLGLTQTFLEKANYENIKMHGGLLTEKPHVSMCFGALYYLILVVFNILLKIASYKK